MDELVSLKNSTLIEQAALALTTYVLKGGVKPGEFLPTEHTLVRKLGIGRSTLREAMQILESRGLIKRLRGRGIQVVDESQQATAGMLQLLYERNGASLNELLEVRRMYEVRAAELAAERATSEDLQEIRTHLEVMQSTFASTEEYLDADLNFHVAIAHATHNRILNILVDTIRPLLQNIIRMTLDHIHRPEQGYWYHERIYNAILARDAKKAAVAMEKHLRGTEVLLNVGSMDQRNLQLARQRPWGVHDANDNQ